MIKLTDELCNVIWDGLMHRIEGVLNEDTTITNEDRTRIMKEIREIHYGKTD